MASDDISIQKGLGSITMFSAKPDSETETFNRRNIFKNYLMAPFLMLRMRVLSKHYVAKCLCPLNTDKCADKSLPETLVCLFVCFVVYLAKLSLTLTIPRRMKV
jgi:hypothetical protein